MKTLVTGLFVLGLTIQSFAQSTQSTKMNEVQSGNLVFAPAKNVNYINSMANNNAPGKIGKLEAEVGSYDITKTEVFKNNFETYEIIFKNSAGNIVATYDKNGKLENAFAKFENTRLPAIVLNAIHSEYPGWTINSTIYRVNYYNDNDVKKVYNVQIENHGKKLNLKVNPNGLILNRKIK